MKASPRGRGACRQAWRVHHPGPALGRRDERPGAEGRRSSARPDGRRGRPVPRPGRNRAGRARGIRPVDAAVAGSRVRGRGRSSGDSWRPRPAPLSRPWQRPRRRPARPPPATPAGAREQVDQLSEAAFAAGQKANQVFEARLDGSHAPWSSSHRAWSTRPARPLPGSSRRAPLRRAPHAEPAGDDGRDRTAGRAAAGQRAAPRSSRSAPPSSTAWTS